MEHIENYGLIGRMKTPANDGLDEQLFFRLFSVGTLSEPLVHTISFSLSFSYQICVLKTQTILPLDVLIEVPHFLGIPDGSSGVQRDSPIFVFNCYPLIWQTLFKN